MAFLVSAPGKVIVFGEHAVVHGKAAMAASISLRSYLHVELHALNEEASINLNFVDIALNHSWPIASLPWTAFEAAHTAAATSPPPTELDPILVEAMQPHITTVSPDLPDTHRKIHQAAASTFLYLYLLLSTPTTSPASFTLRSTIPIGAGLGSSASIAVCLSTALLYRSSPAPGISHSPALTLPSHPSAPHGPLLTLINAYAYLGECLIHGTPSGVDNTVATLGKAVVFRRSATPGAPPSIEPLRRFPELPLLVVDTKQAKSTAVEVAKVRVARERHPAVVGSVLEGIDAVVAAARGEMEGLGAVVDGEEGGAEGLRGERMERIGELVTLNHGLLYSLGVSHPRLEELKRCVDRSGVGWFKLTGAGGGGCGFVLLRPEVKGHVAGLVNSDRSGSAEKLEALEQELGERGFEKYETVLGGLGVGIWAPAAIDSKAVPREEFLAAPGRDGLEALCGPDRDWQHWNLA